MYPTIDEPEIYEAYSHRGFAIPEALPSYGTPQPSAPPYNSTTMRGPVTTQLWSTGLFHCVDDPAISCTSSGATYGVLALTGFACLYSCFTRSRLRAQYNLPEEPCVDCLVHFCCEACALSQEYRELKHQGFDLSIGWEANMERQRRGVTVAPAISPGMTR